MRDSNSTSSRRSVLLPLGEPESGLRERFPTPFAGVDEAGRGCLAGPVAAAACILPPEYDLPHLDDSKKLSPKRRQALEPAIKQQAVAWAVALSWPRVIDEINILQATLRAMRRAVELLKVPPVFLAVDGNQAVPMDLEQAAVKGGDGLIPAISAASVLAKTFRDRLMVALDNRYPEYGFASHKGYGCEAHIRAIREHGPCRLHRLTFAKVKPEPREDQPWLPGI